MQEARLLTILVEFNDNANDDFTGVDGPRDRLREPGRACRAPSRTGRCTTTSRTRRRFTHADNNSFWVPDFSPGALRQDAVHQGGHHRAGPHGPDRSGRPAGHRHLRLHDEEHVRGDVEGRLHGRRRRPPRGSRCRTPRRGTARSRCFQNDEGEWDAGRHPGHERPPGQPARRRRPRPGRGRRARRSGPAASPGTTTTSRTRATSTATATSSSPTASSTTWCSCTPARTSPAAAAHRACTPSGRTPRRSPAATDPGHRPGGLELHRPAGGLRRGRVRPRVRPRPRPARPVRHAGGGESADRLLGPDGHGLAQRPDLPVDPDAHGPLGQVGPRLGRPADLRPGRQGARPSSSARPPARRRAPRTASRSTCRPRSSRSPTRTAARSMWYSGADQDWADVRLTRDDRVPNAADARF